MKTRSAHILMMQWSKVSQLGEKVWGPWVAGLSPTESALHDAEVGKSKYGRPPYVAAPKPRTAKEIALDDNANRIFAAWEKHFAAIA